MNQDNLWAVLQSVLLLSQEKTEKQLINDYNFTPLIAKASQKLYNYLKEIEIVGNPFVNLKTRVMPPIETLTIKFGKIKQEI